MALGAKRVHICKDRNAGDLLCDPVRACNSVAECSLCMRNVLGSNPNSSIPAAHAYSFFAFASSGRPRQPCRRARGVVVEAVAFPRVVLEARAARLERVAQQRRPADARQVARERARKRAVGREVGISPPLLLKRRLVDRLRHERGRRNRRVVVVADRRAPSRPRGLRAWNALAVSAKASKSAIKPRAMVVRGQSGRLKILVAEKLNASCPRVLVSSGGGGF